MRNLFLSLVAIVFSSWPYLSNAQSMEGNKAISLEKSIPLRKVPLYVIKYNFTKNIIVGIIIISSFSNALCNDVHYFFTKVKLNGQTYTFLIDNGAEYSLIFSQRIKEKYEVKRATYVIDTNLDTTTVYITNKKLKLELVDIGITYKMALFVIPKIPESLIIMGIDGIIGNDILSNDDWKLDFKTNTISLVKAKKLDPKKYKHISFDEKLVIDVDLENNNRQNFKTKLNLDLGFHGFISITDTIGFSSDDILRITRTGSVISTKVDTTHIEAVDISFSGLKVSNYPIGFENRKRLNLLGVRFLSTFGEVYLLNSINKIYLPNTDTQTVKLNKVGIFNNVVESYLTKKGDEKSKWNIGEKLDMEYEMKEDDYIYYNIKLEDK